MKTDPRLEHLLTSDELEKLIALTAKSIDNTHRFYYIRALRKLGEHHILLSYVSEHQMDLYNYDAPNLIRLHIDALLEIRDFDQALNVLKQYENFPYFSMETNETISELGEMVQKKRKERTQIRELTIHELERRLASNNFDLVFSAIEYITNNFHESYVPLILKVLKFGKDEMHKSMLFMTLKANGYNKEVTVVKFGRTFNLMPSNIHNVGEDKAFADVFDLFKKISASDDDVNSERLGFEISLRHSLFIYPLAYNKKSYDFLAHYLYYLVLKLQGRIKTFKAYCSRFSLNENDLKARIPDFFFDEFEKTL